jgi:beta-hydroxylase
MIRSGLERLIDDSHPHEVWNETPQHRVVLFVDFERPLPFPVSALNRAVIRRIAKTNYVTSAVDTIQRLGERRAADTRQGSSDFACHPSEVLFNGRRAGQAGIQCL